MRFCWRNQLLWKDMVPLKCECCLLGRELNLDSHKNHTTTQHHGSERIRKGHVTEIILRGCFVKPWPKSVWRFHSVHCCHHEQMIVLWNHHYPSLSLILGIPRLFSIKGMISPVFVAIIFVKWRADDLPDLPSGNPTWLDQGMLVAADTWRNSERTSIVDYHPNVSQWYPCGMDKWNHQGKVTQGINGATKLVIQDSYCY